MNNPETHPLLPNLAAAGEFMNRRVTAFAWLSQCRVGETKNGQPFADRSLSDAEGNLAGKIWSDAGRALQTAAQLERGAAVKVLGEVREYRGSPQLNVIGLRAVRADEEGYDASRIFGEGSELIEGLRCKTLVFDIETVPAVDLRKVPPTIAQAVSKSAERGDGDEGKVMSLSPLFGKVVSLAVGEGELPVAPVANIEASTEASAEEGAGADETGGLGSTVADGVQVLVVPPKGRENAEFPPWIRPMSEPELLRAFWQLARHADLVVSYNGRGFDIPFLIMRSLIHGIPASVDLVGKPYDLRPHLDLFKALYPGRALGPASLDVVCWALGITSPKGVMDGSMVAPTYAMGDIETIAEYNRGDVRATTAVYQQVRDRLLRFRDDW